MHFPAKKDIWFFLIFWGIILAIVLLLFFDVGTTETPLSSGSLMGMIFMTLLILFLVWIWFKTGYTIEDGSIIIRFGPIKQTVKIEDITRINKVKSPFTAPSLAIARLEIFYGKYNVVQISPKNEVRFVQALLEKNPHINVERIL